MFPSLREPMSSHFYSRGLLLCSPLFTCLLDLFIGDPNTVIDQMLAPYINLCIRHHQMEWIRFDVGLQHAMNGCTHFSRVHIFFETVRFSDLENTFRPRHVHAVCEGLETRGR